MTTDPIQVVTRLLENPANPKIVNELVARDATYINLNYDGGELQKILPWAGTSSGPDAFVDTYHRFFKYWDSVEFHVQEIFSAGANVAVFGVFTHRSAALGKSVTSPFSIWAKVKNGKVVFFRYMEDTYATAESFKAGGTWRILVDPEGKPFEV